MPIIELERLSTELTLKRERATLALTLTGGELRFPSGRLDFTLDRIAANSSIFRDLVGEYHFGAKGLGLDAAIRAEHLALADLHSLLSRAPETGGASFDLEIRTTEAGRSTLNLSDLVLESEGSRVQGSVRFAFGGAVAPELLGVDLTLEPLTLALIEDFTGPLPYAGEISGRIRGPPSALTFDLSARLTAPGVMEPFTASVLGRVVLTGPGFRVAELDLDLRRLPLVALRPFVPGLSREGVISGHIFMAGMPGKVPTRLDLRVEVAAGVILVAGVIDLSGAVPSYDLTGTLIDVQLQELLEPAVPPVRLTAEFTLAGTGIRPAQARARLQLSGYFSGWQAGPADSVLITAAVDHGTIALDTAALRLATLEVAASGTWHFEPPVSGDLRYRVAATSLAPFEPYLPLIREGGIAAGSLEAEGTFSGTLAHPHLIGDLEGARLAYDGWSADTLSIAYDLILARPLSHAMVHLVAGGLETPIGPFASAVADLDLDETLIDIDLNAEPAADGGPVVLAASGRIEPDGRRDLTVRRLQFSLGGREWLLTETALVSWGGGRGISIEHFLLQEAEGPGRLSVNGHYPPTAAEELDLEINDLPVAELLAVAGYPPVVMGLLSLDLRLHGPPDAAQARGSFELTNGSYRGESIALFAGTFLAEDRRLDLQATARFDSVGTAQVSGSVPLLLDLRGVPEVHLLRDEPMRISITTDSLALRLLALATPEIRDLEGMVQIQVDLTGTPARPLLAGRAEIQNGALTVVPLNQRYDSIYGLITLTDQQVMIQELRAHSGGWAVVDGTITVAELTNPGFDLTVVFDRFRAMRADDLEAAAVDGELTLTGDLERPVIAGAITLDDGNIDISALQTGRGAAPVSLAALEPVTIAGEEPRETPSLFDRVELDDVVVTAGENFWVVAEQFRAQLAGELILHKVEDGLEISGTLEGTRGVFTLHAGPLVRRFTLVQTSVRFLGTPEINPVLDVTASRLIPGAAGQMTEILIHLRGTLEQPEVTVTTGTGAEVPESELLSFLLFGRPSFAAPGPFAFGGPVLEEAVFGIGSLAELASIGLEEAIISDLGLPLDYFLIQPSQGALGGLGAPIIALGQEIAPNVFITVNAGLGGLFGAATPANAWSVILVWRITPQWTLELGVEPVNPDLFFRGFGTALPIVGFQRQLIVELRRRWTY
jgi:hypothetical protein